MENLYYFLKINECKSFTAASEELHLSQAALSSSIKKLENALNTQLFVRHRRGVYLTEIGEQILPHVEKIVSEYSIIEQICRINLPQKIEIEKINVLTHPLIADAYLSNLALQTLKKYPECHIQIREASIEKCIEELQNNKFDLNLTPIPTIEKSFNIETEFYKVKKLGTDYLAVEMHISHPLAHKKTISLTDLSNTAVVFLNQDLEKDASLASYYIDIRKLKDFVETDNLTLYRNYIANGFVAFTFNKLRKNSIAYFSKEKNILTKNLNQKYPFTYYMFYQPTSTPLKQLFFENILEHNYLNS